MYEDCQLEVSSREAAGLGARVHRPNGRVLCDDEVWGRIARIVASRPKTLHQVCPGKSPLLCKLGVALRGPDL